MLSIEELLHRTIGESIKLKISAANALWATFCDPHQLESALLNLAINSRDAMPNGGKLTIETENCELDKFYATEQRDVTPGQYVCLSVSDTGVGMSSTVRDRAFDPFFTTKPIGQGTGLGLSVSYGIIKDHGGTITVDSTPGRGTVFRISVPLTPPRGQEGAAS